VAWDKDSRCMIKPATWFCMLFPIADSCIWVISLRGRYISKTVSLQSAVLSVSKCFLVAAWTVRNWGEVAETMADHSTRAATVSAPMWTSVVVTKHQSIILLAKSFNNPWGGPASELQHHSICSWRLCYIMSISAWVSVRSLAQREEANPAKQAHGEFFSILFN